MEIRFHENVWTPVVRVGIAAVMKGFSAPGLYLLITNVQTTRPVYLEDKAVKNVAGFDRAKPLIEHPRWRG